LAPPTMRVDRGGEVQLVGADRDSCAPRADKTRYTIGADDLDAGAVAADDCTLDTSSRVKRTKRVRPVRPIKPDP